MRTCSYNRINNTYACENAATLNGYLKADLGFEGAVMSDWGAAKSTIKGALAGLDLEMPDSLYFGDALRAAVQNGSVPLAVLDGMVTRIFTGLYASGFMDAPPTPAQNLSSPATSAAHVALAGELAAASITLLKNARGLLPLSPADPSLRSIALLGDATIFYGGGSGNVLPVGHVPPYDALFAALNGAPVALRPASACRSSGVGLVATPYASAFGCHEGVVSPAACAERCANISGCNAYTFIPNRRCNGWDWQGSPIGTCEVYDAPGPSSSLATATSGTCAPAPLVPTPGGRVNISVYMGASAARAAALAAAADVAILNLALTCGEGADRADLALPAWADALASAVVAANAKTVIVLRTHGAIKMPWLERAAAVLYQGMPGLGAAAALAGALTGAINPSGKLVVSFPVNETTTWLGVGAVNPEQWPGTDRGKGWLEADYSENLSVGYRFYDLPFSPAPLFPFGHGLSYTNFSFSELAVSGTLGGAGGATITCTLTNSGARDGAEVAQLYIAHPAAADMPPKALAGFRKVALKAGAATRLSFSLSAADARIWSVVKQAWELVPGVYGVLVGSSSADIRLTGTLLA